MIGSRCSFSFLPARKWWMRPFEFMARCQTKTIQEQYASSVRIFDVRVRFDERGHVYVCHGLLVYRITEEELFKTFDWIDSMGDCSCRIMLETLKVHLNGNLAIYQEECFVKWCQELERYYHNIEFIGGESKILGVKVYDFGTKPRMKIEEGIDSWWPWLHRKEKNNSILKDFV